METIDRQVQKQVSHLYKSIVIAAFVPALIITIIYYKIFSLGLLIFAFIQALVLVIILGLPIYLILKKYNRISWYACTLSGLLAGSLLPLIMITVSFFRGDFDKADDYLYLTALNHLVTLGGLGAISGVSGWFGLTHDWPFKKKS